MLMLTNEEATIYLTLEGATPSAICIINEEEYENEKLMSNVLEVSKYDFTIRHKNYPGFDITVQSISSLSEHTAIDIERLCQIFDEQHEQGTMIVDPWVITSIHKKMA